MHPLDNVIWNALTTRQACFAEGLDQARRFHRDVTLLTAFSEPSDQAYGDLGRLYGAGGTGALFIDEPYTPRPGWSVVGGAPLLQMVCENGWGTSEERCDFIELGSGDSPEMLELTGLTKPGPFGPRTHELGIYLGIRLDGKLVAMAGERLKVAGFTEVSAVCTHPEHTGKGYARVLMAEIMRRVRERGETPFLHVRQDNVRAVEIYEKLGFHERKLLHFVVLRKG